MKKFLIATGVAALAFASVASAQGFAFNTNLTVGSTGSDVIALQSWLISNGFNIPSIASGAAAKGYFGAQTAAAVKMYQASRGIPNTGFVGPLTRAALNSNSGVVTTNPGFVCPPGYQCIAPGSGTGTNPPSSTGSSEGELNSFSTLGDVESEVEEGDTDSKVLGIEFDAEDSRMTISRVDVDFEETSAAANSARLSRYISSVSLWLDGKKIAEKDVDEASEDSDVYSFRFTGLNASVADGDTAELYVSVDALDSIDGNDEDAEWTVTIADDGIRAVDTAGISDTYGVTGDAEETFDISGLAGVELKVSRSASDEDDRTVEISDEDDTAGVTLLTFKLKAEDSEITVDEIPVTIATTTGTTVGVGIGQIAKRFTLYRGTTLLDSVTATSSTNFPAYIVFTDLDLALDADETVEFMVKADINDLEGTFVNGDGLKASIPSANVAAIDAEDSMGDALTGGELSGTATGEDVVFFTEGIAVDLVGTPSFVVGKSSDSAVDDVVTFSMKFKVTAFGESAYIATTTASTTNSTRAVEWSVIGDTFTGLGSSNLTSTADKTTNNNAFLVEEGGSGETFTLTVVLNNANGTAGFYGIQIDRILFDDTDSAVISTYEALTTGLDALETDEIPLN